MKDNQIRTNYATEVTNRFHVLQDLNTNDNANSTYNNIIEANRIATANIIPLKPKEKRHIPWEKKKVSEKRQKLKELNNIKLTKPTQENLDRVKVAKGDLNKTYEVEQKKYVEDKIKELQNAHENQKSRLVWATLDEASGRKKTTAGQNKARSTVKRVDLSKKHFQNLLGQAPVIDDIPIQKVYETLSIETGELTIEELKLAMKDLKNNKATGLDEIPVEVWKTGCFDNELLIVCNKTYGGDAASIWRQAFPKKGNLAITGNYWSITQTAVVEKIYNQILRNRIRPHIDSLLHKQNNKMDLGNTEQQLHS